MAEECKFLPVQGEHNLLGKQTVMAERKFPGLSWRKDYHVGTAPTAICKRKATKTQNSLRVQTEGFNPLLGPRCAER